MYEFNKNANIDFELLDMDDYDAFLMTHAVPKTPQPFSTTQSPNTPILFTQNVPNQGPTTPGMTTGFNPMIYMNPMNPTPPMTQQTSISSSFMNSVKCDIKQYPTFAGDFDKWPYFKRQVIALAATHGLEDVFVSKLVVPLNGDPDF